VDVQDVAFSGLCAGLAVLTPQQKESGVIVMDMGGGTTDYIAYADKAIAAAGTLAVGGDHITNDIALGLNISMRQAERLKVEAGSAVLDPMNKGQKVTLPTEGGFQGKDIKLMDLHTIINARIDEMLNMIKGELSSNNIVRKTGAGIILTGGGSNLRRLTDLTSQIFDVPCCIGIPRNISGLAVVTEGTQYAVPLGLIRYGFMTGQRHLAQGGWIDRLRDIFRK